MKLRNANPMRPFLSALAVVVVIAIGCTPTSTLAPESTPTPTSTFTPTATATPTPSPTATPTPSPTATPTPSPTATPTPSPTVEVSLVVTRYDVQQLSDRALVHLRWLSQELGSRPSASPQEREAAEYVAQQLRSYGYQVELQEFKVQVTEEIGENLKIEVPVEQAMTTITMSGSGHGEVSAPLVFVKLGRAQDFAPEGLEGGIALIQRGETTFRQKVENALRFGASGVVIFNNESGLFRGTLRQAFQIPVVAISSADGEVLLSLLKQGEVKATLRVIQEERTTQNVVATKGNIKRPRGTSSDQGEHQGRHPGARCAL